MSIKTLTDALPFNVGSFLGSGMGDYLASLDFKVDYAAENSANLLKLQAGRIDLWASDVLTADYLAHQAELNLGEAELVFFTTLRAMACHNNVPESTIVMLNRTLKAMYRDGSIGRLQKLFSSRY